MFKFLPTLLRDTLVVQPTVRGDKRGRFVKLFHQSSYAEHHLETCFSEVYYSTSEAGVLRGMHFQDPPYDYIKIVTCIVGEVFDALVDLRRDSPTYGQHVTFRLSADQGTILYIPRGVAHGFCVEQGSAVMAYMTSCIHVPEADKGIAWDSAGIEWPIRNPLLSDRDRTFPRLADFASPFHGS